MTEPIQGHGHVTVNLQSRKKWVVVGLGVCPSGVSYCSDTPTTVPKIHKRGPCASIGLHHASRRTALGTGKPERFCSAWPTAPYWIE